MQGGQPNLCSVRNLAYLALIENDQSSVRSRICEMRCVIFTWRVFYSVFLTRRLVVPRSEHQCEGTPFFFLRRVVGALVNGARKKRVYMSEGDKSKAKTVALSEVIDGVIKDLKQLNDFSFSTEELKGVGITSSFQDLPCMFDICLTEDDGENEKTIRVKRELKHILKKRFLPQTQEQRTGYGEKYQTYVNVGIEHCVKSAKWKSRLRKIVALCVVTLVLFLAIVGAVAIAGRFTIHKQEMQISKSAVQLLKGKTNLVQKVEISAKCEGMIK